MNDQERRQEILQAEEAIRQLAEELGKTKSSNQILVRGISALEQANQTLQDALRRIDLSNNYLKNSKDAIETASNDLSMLSSRIGQIYSFVRWIIVGTGIIFLSSAIIIVIILLK